MLLETREQILKAVRSKYITIHTASRLLAQLKKQEILKQEIRKVA